VKPRIFQCNSFHALFPVLAFPNKRRTAWG
jgi:hypothetical protein